VQWAIKVIIAEPPDGMPGIAIDIITENKLLRKTYQFFFYLGFMYE